GAHMITEFCALNQVREPFLPFHYRADLMQTPAEREVSCPVPTRKTPNQLQTSSRCSLYYSILLDQVQLALIVRDLEDRICFWNKGAEHLYGWRADEVTGENVYDLLFPLDVNDQPFKEETELQNLSVGGLYLRLKRMVREGAEVFSPCGCP